MTFNKHLKNLLLSITPGRYKQLIIQKLSKAVFFQIANIFFLLLISLILAIPAFFSLATNIQKDLGSFQEFSIDFNVSMNNPVVLSKYPLIVVDVNKENIIDETILLNNQGVLIKKYWKEKSIDWKNLKSVPENANRFSRWFLVLTILLIPSLLLTIFLLELFLGLILVIISFLLALLITKVTKFSINSSVLVKCAVFSLSLFYITHLLPMAYFRWIIVPIIIYFMAFFLSVWFSGKNKYEQRN